MNRFWNWLAEKLKDRLQIDRQVNYNFNCDVKLVEQIEANPGTILVVETDQYLSAMHVKKLREDLERVWPSTQASKIVILQGGLKLTKAVLTEQLEVPTK